MKITTMKRKTLAWIKSHPVWSVIIVLLLIGFVGSLFNVSSEETAGSSIVAENGEGVQSVESMDIEVTSQTVKRIDEKCRYFFDIRNRDDIDFAGSIDIQLFSQEENFIWSDTFSAMENPIAPNVGKSVYMDTFTCPPSIHGDKGITSFKYEVLIANEIVKAGTGEITNQWEDLN